MHRSLSPIARRAMSGFSFIDPPANPDPASPPAGGGGGANPPADPPADPPKDRTFTQAEVTAMMAREKKEGGTAAVNKLAEELGVTIEVAKDIVKKAKEADDATKTEAQKDREQAARERAEAETEKSAAKQEVHQARLERAFSKVGVDLTDEKEKSKNERLLRLVTAEVGTSFEDIALEVTEIQKQFPGLFTAVTGTPPKAPNGDPVGTPPKPTSGEDKFDAGRKRAEAQRASAAPPSLLSKIPGFQPPTQ